MSLRGRLVACDVRWRGSRAGVVIKDGTISHFLEGVVLDTGSNNNTVTNVRVSVNAGDGIFVTASSNDQLTGNQVEGNSGDGIDLTSNSSNVVISGNTALNNGHEGIEVCGGSSGQLSNNVANGNTNDGIGVCGHATTVTGNRGFFNGVYGINVEAGTTDGGKNVVQDNGDQRQCLNIVCTEVVAVVK